MPPTLIRALTVPSRWWVLGIATLQQAGLTFVRFGLPALAPFIRQDLRLSLAETGVVLGAFDLGALLAFYATGVATDRFGGRWVMAAGALGTGLLAALAAFAPSGALLVVGLALAGMGFPTSQVAGSYTVMNAFPPGERGLAMGIRQAGLPVGGLLAALVLPWVAARWGWREAMLVAAAGCALAGLVTAAGLSGSEDPPRTAPRDLQTAPARFVRNPNLMRTTLTACLLAAGQFGLTGYLPLYFVDVFSWRPADAARLLLLVHLGGVAGRMAWGWVSDRWFGTDRVRPLALAGVCGAGVIVVLALLGFRKEVPIWTAAGLATLAGFTLLGWNGLYLTLLSELAGASSAVMVGLSMTVLYVFTMLTPPLFGWAVQRMGGAYAAAWLGIVGLQLAASTLIRSVKPLPR